MTVLHPLCISNWHPATINQLLKSVRDRIRLKKADRNMVFYMAKELKVPRATGKRRVHLTIIMKPKQRGADPDAYNKSLLDALVHAGLLRNDSHQWAEIAPVRYERGTAKQWGSLIVLEDI